MAGPIKRLRYFDEQFLRASDLNDSEGYHLGMRRRHNRLLHTLGVAGGLVVAPASATSVSVSPGTALDFQGREIVLEDPEDLELAGLPGDAPAWVFISFAERPTDPSDETGVLDDTRWTEEPKLEALAAPPADDTVVLLATVTRVGQNVQAVDNSMRHEAGVREATTKVNRSGDHVTGDLTVAGKLGVGAATLPAILEVAGDVAIHGKHALRGNDPWLRLNQDGEFALGTHTHGLFAPERLNVGGQNGYGDPGGSNAWFAGSIEAWGDLTVHGNVRLASATDVRGDIAIHGKHALRGNDPWLRLNQDGEFALGTHTHGLFAPERLNVGGQNGYGDPGGSNAWFAGSVEAWGALTVHGDVHLGSDDRFIHIGGNQTGVFMQLHDDLWFSDPQDATIQIRNGDDSNWGTMVGSFNAPSSIEFKTDVEELSCEELTALLNAALSTEIVRFKYRGEDARTGRERIGVLAERCPEYLLGPDRRSVNVGEYVALVHGAVKALARDVERLAAHVQDQREPGNQETSQ